MLKFKITVNIYPNLYTAILKTNLANNIIWQSAYAFQPLFKCLEIDKTEQNFYIAIADNSAVIVKSDASTGAFNSAIRM